MSDRPKNPDELGALWLKHSAKGPYMTGSVTIGGVETRLVLFPNNKKSEKSPDWRVMLSKPKAETRKDF